MAHRISRKVVVLGAAAVAGLLVALAFFSIVLWPGFLAPAPSKAEQAKTIAELESVFHESFGDSLESVSVHYGRYVGVPTYFGEFRLRGIPLRFGFQPSVIELETLGLSGASLIDNSRIGGKDAFLKLCSAYHRDFPDEDSMYYWQVDDLLSLPDSIRTRVHSGGPTVLVYDHNDYWGFFADATELGVYSWDPASSEWDLAYRGGVSDAH